MESLNEPETTNEAAVPYFKEVFDLANKLDMQKRVRAYLCTDYELLAGYL